MRHGMLSTFGFKRRNKVHESISGQEGCFVRNKEMRHGHPTSLPSLPTHASKEILFLRFTFASTASFPSLLRFEMLSETKDPVRRQTPRRGQADAWKEKDRKGTRRTRKRRIRNVPKRMKSVRMLSSSSFVFPHEEASKLFFEQHGTRVFLMRRFT